MPFKREEMECACITSEMASSLLAGAPLYAWSESIGSTANFSVRRQVQGSHFTEKAELVDKGGAEPHSTVAFGPLKDQNAYIRTLRPSFSTLNPSGRQARLIYEWRIGIRADD
jgi:hypothetical protein